MIADPLAGYPANEVIVDSLTEYPANKVDVDPLAAYPAKSVFGGTFVIKSKCRTKTF